MMLFLALLISLALSYMIASTYFGPDNNLMKTVNKKSSFKLIVTVHEKRIVKLTIMLTPLLLLIEIIIYCLWLRDVIY